MKRKIHRFLFNSNKNEMSTSDRIVFSPNLKRLNIDDNDDDDDREDPSNAKRTKRIDRPNDPSEVHPNSKQYLIYSSGKPSIISKTAHFWSSKYLRILDHINPEIYDIYVHEDFVCYAEFELIENVIFDFVKDLKFLSTNEKQITFARTIYAFRRWEALIILVHKSLAWTRIDHGQRLLDIVRLIDACSVAIVRKVFPQAFFERFQEEIHSKQLKKIFDRLINLKTIFECAVSLGDQLSKIVDYSSEFIRLLEIVYHFYLSFIENKSFTLKDDENQTGFIHHQSLWRGLSEPTQRFDESFQLNEAFETYRKTYPDMAGNAHDLRRWSPQRQQQFSIKRFERNLQDHQEFWFRM